MSKFFRCLISYALLISSVGSPISVRAESEDLVELKNIQARNDSVALYFDQEVSYSIFSLSDPPRIVVELPNISQKVSQKIVVNGSLLLRVRTGQFRKNPLISRVVLDLVNPVEYHAQVEEDRLIIRLGDRIEEMGEVTGHLEEAVIATATPSRKKKSRRAVDIISNLPTYLVDLDFPDTDIRDIISVLAEISGINIIYGADVSGTLTIRLDQVPFDQSFQTILAMVGLTTQQMADNVLRVLTPETLSKHRAKASLVQKTITLNYVKASEVQKHLQVVRISPSAKITIDDENNLLVLYDTPEGIAAAERLLLQIDKAPRQVMIEAKIVEVSLTDNFDLGVQWELAHNRKDGTTTTEIGQLRETGGRTGVSDFVRSAGGAGAGAVTTLGSALTSSLGGTGVGLAGPTAAGIAFGIINSNTLFSAQLSALVDMGRTKILASPKIVTINNKKAKIQIGTSIPFNVVTVAQSGVATQSTQFVQTGIILEVTPIINADRSIRLDVKPEVSIPGTIIPQVGPQIDTRNAETSVLIYDGQTLVIGGLIDEQLRSTIRKVPLLGDIPVLGVFFRNVSEQENRSELIIFITPTIL